MSRTAEELVPEIESQSAALVRLREEVGKVIVGQTYMVDRLLMGLIADGHILLEGIPGLAKTTAVKTVAQAIQTGFSRIQFTPDLLPADLIGTEVYRPQNHDFLVKKGPVFANLLLAEAGLLTVTVFGVALGNANLPSIEELRRFKENITVALVSVLFIVLTADLDPALLRALDWHGALLILLVIFVLRPVAVAFATIGTDLSWQERVLVGWIAPRGIVAAAVAGAFSARMLEAGYADADRLLPLVFLLIVTTVVLHGFSLPWVARHLGLASKRADGLVLVGASPWSIDLAVRLKELDIPVLMVDASWHRLRPARLASLPIHFGQVISESADRNLDLSSIGYVMAATDNDAYNALVCTRFSNEFNRSSVFQLPMPGADADDRTGLTPTLRGQRVFSGEALYETLLQRYFEGWRFQKTRLSEEYGFDKYCARVDAELFATLVVKAGGGLVLDVTRYQPVAGDVIVNFLPPES